MKREGVSGEEDAFTRELSKRGWLMALAKDFASGVSALSDQGIGRFYYQDWQPGDSAHIDLLSQVLKGM